MFTRKFIESKRVQSYANRRLVEITIEPWEEKGKDTELVTLYMSNDESDNQLCYIVDNGDLRYHGLIGYDLEDLPALITDYSKLQEVINYMASENEIKLIEESCVGMGCKKADTSLVQSYILVSLFNGIGGASLALEGKNIVKTYISEIDKHANIIHMANYPNSVQLGDITQISKETIIDIKNEAVAMGAKILLIGGSPCQNFSFQGYMNGMSTVCNREVLSLEEYLFLKEKDFHFKGQSFLFWEYIRIKELLQPDYFLLENVKMVKKWSDIIDSAVKVDFLFLNSHHFSAQSRPRYYWTNIHIDYKIFGMTNQDIVFDMLDNNGEWQEVTSYLKGMYGKKRRIDYVTNIFSKCHTIPASIYKVNISSWVKDDRDRIHKLTPTECEKIQGVPVGYTDHVAKSHRLKGLGNGFQIDTVKQLVKEL